MNPELKNSINRFLAEKTIAIVGDTWKRDDPAPHVLKRLKQNGFNVIPIAPGQSHIDDTTAYTSLLEVPVSVGAVLVTGNAKLSAKVVEECAQRNIHLVWLHSGLGTSPKKWMRKMEYAISSVGPEAMELARKHNITLIPGACPMMFCANADVPHRIVRSVLETLGCFEERKF